MIELTWEEVLRRGQEAAKLLPPVSNIYPIPRGGMFAALAILASNSERRHKIVSSREEATVYVDDVIDSGATRDRHSDKPFIALVDKQQEGIRDWIVFPWEKMSGETSPEDCVRRLIEYIGDDPNREGLLETPRRVIRSYQELFSGYRQDPSKILKVFHDDSCDEMVVVKDIEIYSMCEHHMLPFFGRCHVAYIPDGRIVGVSKLVRLVEVYSRRLQIQERLCQQVTQAIDKYLEPKGSACLIESSHLCMACRGVRKQHSKMITSSLTGVFRDLEVRMEFLSMCLSGGKRGGIV